MVPSTPKQDNTRFIITILAMVVVAATAMFFVSRSARIDIANDNINRDGISCVLEQLQDHRLNAYTAQQENAESRGEMFVGPAPAPQPLPRELIQACMRFFETP